MRRTTELLEGQPSDVYVVRFGNHEVYRHWNAFSFKDPIFRTRDGLGVGSTIAEFETVYGKGQLIEAEGCAIHFRFDARMGHFAILCPGTPQSSGSYKTELAKEIWVW